MLINLKNIYLYNKYQGYFMYMWIYSAGMIIYIFKLYINNAIKLPSRKVII